RGEALPLRGHARDGYVVVALAETSKQQRLAIDEARVRKIHRLVLVHPGWLRQCEVGETGARTYAFGRNAKLVVERSREGLVRAVSGIERDRKDIGRALDEC